eukprot:UN03622
MQKLVSRVFHPSRCGKFSLYPTYAYLSGRTISRNASLDIQIVDGAGNLSLVICDASGTAPAVELIGPVTCATNWSYRSNSGSFDCGSKDPVSFIGNTAQTYNVTGGSTSVTLSVTGFGTGHFHDAVDHDTANNTSASVNAKW